MQNNLSKECLLSLEVIYLISVVESTLAFRDKHALHMTSAVDYAFSHALQIGEG